MIISTISISNGNYQHQGGQASTNWCSSKEEEESFNPLGTTAMLEKIILSGHFPFRGGGG